MAKCIGTLEARQNEAGVTRWHWTVTNPSGERETSFAYTEALGLRDLESALRDCERKARRWKGGVPHPSSSGPRRGFAGSPSHHASLADKAVDDVVAYAQEAQRLTQVGRCGDAIVELRRAHRATGYIGAHVAESERPKLGTELMGHYDEQLMMAEDAFAKKCIVKKARR